MVINPISVQGEITRAQDMSAIKHNEDNKGMVQQFNIQRQHETEADTRAHQVQRKDDTENEGKKYDAKEKGNGQYAGDGGQRRKKDGADQSDGKVVIKGRNSFDIKI